MSLRKDDELEALEPRPRRDHAGATVGWFAAQALGCVGAFLTLAGVWMVAQISWFALTREGRVPWSTVATACTFLVTGIVWLTSAIALYRRRWWWMIGLFLLGWFLAVLGLPDR